VSRIPIITGLGLVTPLGNTADETWNALLAGRFITTHARCPLDRTSPDRVHRLAVAAAREAVEDAHWNDRPGGALVVGTSKGSVDRWLAAPPVDSFLESTALAVRASLPLLDGPSLTLSAACASGLHALIRAVMMIRSGEVDRVVVVAAEASVSPLFLGSFRRMGVLPREEIGCRPFDQDRDGFLMSEAAAAVCLEAAGPDEAFRGYVAAERIALGGDAIHMTSGDPDGTVLRRLLKTVVAGRAVELIHAHGTGTIFNDPIELAAFDAECVRDDSPGPLIYSHKGALGHSLGASGLVSTALSCLMHRNRVVLPNVRTTNPIATRHVQILSSAKGQATTRSLVSAAGFGGPVAVVSLVSG
jgi:3-oxoacyl-[acyl-carrier-protein] synthase II